MNGYPYEAPYPVEVLARQCTECKAEPGNACRTPGGRIRGFPCPARHDDE